VSSPCSLNAVKARSRPRRDGRSRQGFFSPSFFCTRPPPSHRNHRQHQVQPAVPRYARAGRGRDCSVKVTPVSMTARNVTEKPAFGSATAAMPVRTSPDQVEYRAYPRRSTHRRAPSLPGHEMPPNPTTQPNHDCRAAGSAVANAGFGVLRAWVKPLRNNRGKNAPTKLRAPLMSQTPGRLVSTARSRDPRPSARPPRPGGGPVSMESSRKTSECRRRDRLPSARPPAFVGLDATGRGGPAPPQEAAFMGVPQARRSVCPVVARPAKRRQGSLASNKAGVTA